MSTRSDVYILAARQISVQPPLTDAWMDAPVRYDAPYVQAIDPDYRQHFAPNEARRLGKILKRAMLTSRQVMAATGIANPDAIITGTGLGCIENTEIFLNALVREGEELLTPTHFMQSTHNTIGSLIAIDAGCRGYNATYAHKGTSFECALADAVVQLESRRIQTALVGAHDEMTPGYFTLLKRTGYLGHAVNGFAGEVALSMMLASARGENALCRLRGVEMEYCPYDGEALRQALNRLLQRAQCSLDEVDAVMTGVSGRQANDQVYASVCSRLFPNKKLLRYKHLFGEAYTAPGLGLYAAAVCLGRQHIPAHLLAEHAGGEQRSAGNILFYNQMEGKNHSFILLSPCGK
ncbi:MAG: beta-ketoacyl synthase chain length factor [Prevotellaceae bacterium]|jgi:3-oxoacyl-(acyl-carrier-protein) synthase|nr:beta-ketoacyl synthase chain length factor [Prevotellaceae bacterium]